MLATVIVIAYVILVVIGIILSYQNKEMASYRRSLGSLYDAVATLDSSKADRRRGRPVKVEITNEKG